MGNPIDNLKATISGMTEAQKKVADYIISNSFDIAFVTVEQLAACAGTSTTTIMRLMTYLGYSGYSDFQKSLRENLRDRVNPKTRLEANIRDIAQTDLWEQCYEKQIRNIEKTFENLPSETLNQISQKIAQARRIYVASARGGSMVAEYLHLFLSRMFGNSVWVKSDFVAGWSTMLPDMSQEDVVIAISFPRYAKSLVNFASAAKQRNAYIVAITDSYSSPLSVFSATLLPCACGSLGFHNSPVSAMLLADCLINVTSIQNSSRVKERLEVAAELLDDIGYYYND